MPASTLPEKIRTQQRLIVTVAALIFGPILMLVPTVGGVAMLIGDDYSLQAWAFFPVCLMVSGLFIYHMFQNYHWLEIDGPIIRGRKFWTREFVEQRIDEISAVVPAGSATATIENVVADQILGSVRGYEIRFHHGGRKMYVVRHDMVNADPFIRELLARMPRQA